MPALLVVACKGFVVEVHSVDFGTDLLAQALPASALNTPKAGAGADRSGPSRLDKEMAAASNRGLRCLVEFGLERLIHRASMKLSNESCGADCW